MGHSVPHWNSTDRQANGPVPGQSEVLLRRTAETVLPMLETPTTMTWGWVAVDWRLLVTANAACRGCGSSALVVVAGWCFSNRAPVPREPGLVKATPTDSWSCYFGYFEASTSFTIQPELNVNLRGLVEYCSRAEWPILSQCGCALLQSIARRRNGLAPSKTTRHTQMFKRHCQP